MSATSRPIASGDRLMFTPASGADATLLTYAVLVNPNPLQVNGAGTITLEVSNSTRTPITCSRIVITLPVGTNAKDLVATGAGITAQVPANWNADRQGGAITLTPTDGGVIGGSGTVFTIAIRVNGEPGTAALVIAEDAAQGSGAPATRRTTIPIAKFPVQFSISDLIATPAETPYGGSVRLMWSGSPATYTLVYSGHQRPEPVGNVGPFDAKNVTVFPAVFTLTATIAVPGQDTPLTAQRQTTVTQEPELAILSFNSSKTAVGGADGLVLSWQVQMARAVTLQLAGVSGTVDVTGVSRCTVSGSGNALVVVDDTGRQLGRLSPPQPVPQFLTFVLTASADSSTQHPLQVEVLRTTITSFTAWRTRTPSPDGDWDYRCYAAWATSNAGAVTMDRTDGGSIGPSGQRRVGCYMTHTLYAQGFGYVVSQNATWMPESVVLPDRLMSASAPAAPAPAADGAASNAATLLTYALYGHPDPLQVSGPATLTLVVSNGTHATVTCTKIVVTLPVGTNAKDLVASAATIATQVPANWSADRQGGVITLTPTDGGVIGGKGAAFTIGFKVNGEPGTAPFTIVEEAGQGGEAPASRSTIIPIGKFPEQFSISDLIATPSEVPFGGNARLMWTGSPATYTLSYPGKAPQTVQNMGPYDATDITIFPAVFTLTASVAVPGQDQPLVAQRQTTVTKQPELAILSFDASTIGVGGDGVVLSWEVQLATKLTLQLSGVKGTVDVTGASRCRVFGSGNTLMVADDTGRQLGTLTPPQPVPQFLTFVLTATATRSTQRPVQVEVLPTTIDSLVGERRQWLNPEFRPIDICAVVWSTTNAGPVTTEPLLSVYGPLPASGWLPAAGPAYTMHAQGFGYVVSRSVTVRC